MKMRTAATALVAVGMSSALLVGIAPAAQAATITIATPKQTVRANSAGYYTVKPVLRLPSGAVKTSTPKITVKKGTSVIAKNVTSKKVRKGTYKVTSSVNYKVKKSRLVSTTVSERVEAALCTPDYLPTVAWDQTTYYPSYYGSPWVAGSVTFEYTGRCAGYDSTGTIRVWDATWQDDDYVLIDPAWAMPGDPGYNDMLVSDAMFGPGDSYSPSWTFSDVSGTVPVTKQVTQTYYVNHTQKAVRTVVVR